MSLTTQHSAYALNAYCQNTTPKNILNFIKHTHPNYKRWYSTACLIILLAFSSKTMLASEKYSSVKIYLPKSEDERFNLLGLLEIDHFHEQDGYFMTTLDARAI